jgi:large subunit ribosomal protein L3
MSEAKLSLPAFFGIKAGMTRIFDSNGNHIPVTVVKLIPNVVTQVKTKDKDGYAAYQVGFGEKRETLLNSPEKGHLKKSSIPLNLTKFAEVRLDDVRAESIGAHLSFEEFKPATYVDITGVSKGKGTQGVMKRYNFQGGPASHGSHFHRRPGSIGCRATPARVFAEKKMPGRMGNERVTIQNSQILEINTAEGYALIKGSIPGAKNSFVRITKAVKKG